MKLQETKGPRDQGTLVKGQRCAADFGVRIEAAATENGVRRIKGYANTFGVMRSGRIIHPAAVEDWLNKTAQARVPLLAQHGWVAGFATLGRVDVLRVDRAKGLYFEAAIATGLPLAEEAWVLISQAMLDSLSVGWVANQWRYVKRDDKDLDPWFAQKMDEAGVVEALAFIDVELVEISVVDVGDDRDAKLAARLAELQGAGRGAQGAGDNPLIAGSTHDDIRALVREAVREEWAECEDRFLDALDARMASIAPLACADLDELDVDGEGRSTLGEGRATLDELPVCGHAAAIAKNPGPERGGRATPSNRGAAPIRSADPLEAARRVVANW